VNIKEVYGKSTAAGVQVMSTELGNFTIQIAGKDEKFTTLPVRKYEKLSSNIFRAASLPRKTVPSPRGDGEICMSTDSIGEIHGHFV